MKIIMIAGFYDQVLKEIKQKFPDQCAERMDTADSNWKGGRREAFQLGIL